MSPTAAWPPAPFPIQARHARVPEPPLRLQELHRLTWKPRSPNTFILGVAVALFLGPCLLPLMPLMPLVLLVQTWMLTRARASGQAAVYRGMARLGALLVVLLPLCLLVMALYPPAGPEPVPVPLFLGLSKGLVALPLVPLLALRAMLGRGLDPRWSQPARAWLARGSRIIGLIGIAGLLVPPIFELSVDASIGALFFLGMASMLVSALAMVLGQASLQSLEEPIAQLVAMRKRVIPALDDLGFRIRMASGGIEACGFLDEQPLLLALQDSVFPPRVAIEVQVPELSPFGTLSVRARDRESDEADRVALQDPVLSQALCVRGIEPARADALFEDLHALLLPIIPGRPGSCIDGDRVVLEAPLLSRPEPPEIELRMLMDEALSLARALAARSRLSSSPP